MILLASSDCTAFIWFVEGSWGEIAHRASRQIDTTSVYSPGAKSPAGGQKSPQLGTKWTCVELCFLVPGWWVCSTRRWHLQKGLKKLVIFKENNEKFICFTVPWWSILMIIQAMKPPQWAWIISITTIEAWDSIVATVNSVFVKLLRENTSTKMRQN